MSIPSEPVNASHTASAVATEAAAPFRPYIRALRIGALDLRFFFATDEARAWYDPIKPYALLEYQWVLSNVPLAGERILDCGAHHGQYALLFALGSGNAARVLAVDAVESNCAIVEVNLALNGARAGLWCGAVGMTDGEVCFTGETNGRVVERGPVTVPCRTLATLMPDATIVKLDVEGEEFRILPPQLDALPSVHTWIVEVHPWKTRDPKVLVELFLNRGFKLDWVNRAKQRVEPYPADADWTTHSTLFARRK